jgi:hypothetical protein
MLPELKKIIRKKSLILFGDINEEDLVVLRDNLPKDGLFFHIVVPTKAEALNLLSLIRAWK